MTSDTLRLHNQGKRCFESGLYPEAEWYYQRALEVGVDCYGDIAALKLDIAAAWQMMRRYGEAAKVYHEEIMSSGAYVDLARKELAKLQERKRQWLVPSEAHLLTADDQRLLDIATPMLANYPALVRPVHIAWVDESCQSLRRIQEMQQSYGVAEEELFQSLTGWEALGVIIGYWHLVMVRSDWQQANDSALCGLLSHELAHEELKDTFRQHFIDPKQSRLTFVCNERATDLLAISKGYGADLLESRRFMERIRSSLDQSQELTTSEELARLLL